MGVTNQQIYRAIDDLKAEMLRTHGETREDIRELRETVGAQNSRIRTNEQSITRLNVMGGIASSIGLAGLGVVIKKLFG